MDRPSGTLVAVRTTVVGYCPVCLESWSEDCEFPDPRDAADTVRRHMLFDSPRCAIYALFVGARINPPASEFAFRCRLCGFKESWTTNAACDAAGLWHLYDDHPAEWAATSGPRPPSRPRPIELGDRFDPSESQASF